MQLERPRARRAFVALTPLIDVVFILLVFFMLASNLTRWQTVQLGDAAASGSGVAAGGAWWIRIQAAGLDLNGEPISTSELARRLDDRIRIAPEQPILVQPGRDVRLQGLVDLLDLLHGRGATRVTLVGL